MRSAYLLLSLISLSLAVTQCTAAADQQARVLRRVKRVVNGHNSRRHEWPWQVSLQKDGVHVCGGSLITQEWILTAAHCVKGDLEPRRYSIIVGEHRLYNGKSSFRKKIFVKEIYNHSMFHNSHKRYDVALVLLDGWVRINRAVRPIQLPVQGDRVRVGKICYLTGWGDTQRNGRHADILQKAPMRVTRIHRCRARNGNTVHDKTMICAGDRGQVACHGDSGGPLACYERGRWILRGVVSWGKQNCVIHHFTVFARVSWFVNWIYRTQNTECRRYRVLNTRDRAQGQPKLNQKQCDRNFITTGWYRFSGLAGYRMPTSCVPEKHCGTDAPGWLYGSHPTPSQGVVSRRVFYHWKGNCTRWSNTINVRNCGRFYVYRLVKPPGCNFRYCGNGKNPAPECSNYKILDKLDRAQSQPSLIWKCDFDDLDAGWYRFAGQAGNGIAKSCVPSNRCGTTAAGWMRGSHPTQAQGVVGRLVCYTFDNDCCLVSNWISVRNCGSFYVYKLPKPPGCSMRYCGNGAGSTSISALSSVCKNYQLLNTADRSRKYWRRRNYIRKCDQNDVIDGRWYRFAKYAGTKMATSCVPGNRCGTRATGWMTGRHPSMTEGVVVRRVCYSWDGQCCRWSNKIRVRNCGDYHIYQLYRPVGCNLRYCGNGEASQRGLGQRKAGRRTTT